MTKKRLSSETAATVALTLISLVGGLAVACTAGVGPRVIIDSGAEAAQPEPTPTPTPTPTPSQDVEPALESVRLRFPPGAVVDVKAAYRAKGDGETDDTAALQKAISENPGRTLYLPVGTYLVSKPLEAHDRTGRWQSQLRLYGEDRKSTVIKLKDGAPGYASRGTPRPVLHTGSVDGLGGDGSDGYGNHLENFTVNTGSNNPGAVGIDYVGAHVAAIRRVTVTGKGLIGLALTRPWPGPALISRVSVRGFDHGIKVAQGQYGLTLEHIALSGQKVSGVDNTGNILAIRDLTSTNAVPAVRNVDRMGLVTLVDAKLTGGKAGASAVESAGELMARRVTTAGYRSAITQAGKVIPGGEVAEYVSKPPLSLHADPPARALDLPVRQAPEFVDAEPDNWVNVLDHGAKADDDVDDSAAIQRAIDAGKPVVYLPTGRYVLTAPLQVRGAVRQVLGLNATLTPGGRAFANANAPAGLFEIGDGPAPDVTVSGVTITRARQPAPTPGMIGFVHRTARPLVIRDVTCCGEYKWSYQPERGAGPLFLENVSGSRWQFDQPGQQVWARQLNAEDTVAGGAPRLVNAGATVSILGFETEQSGPVLRTERTGRTEVLGGAIFESSAGTGAGVGTSAGAGVAFECLDDASISLSFATMGNGNAYRVLVRQRKGGTSKDLGRGQAVSRGDGRIVTLYTG